jgi:signal transduction histidine kinase
MEILAQYIQDLTKLLRAHDALADDAELQTLKKEIGYPSMIDDINSILADCRDGAERIRGIVQNLRTFSRLDEAEYMETNIHEGLDATIRLLSRYFGSGNITVRREYGELPTVQTFSGQLNQVWMNLLANAAQAVGASKGTVTVSTQADENNIFVEISDTGCGIAIQDLKRIFDPFFTTKAVGAGTGLGLSISMSIIERHGGSISVSTVLGSGTTFKVRLPRNFEPDFSATETSITPYAS